MFGYTLVPTEEYLRLQRSDRRVNDLHQGHRWLSEFDWLLNPFWKYMGFDKSEPFGRPVEECRESMRARMGTRYLNLMKNKETFHGLMEHLGNNNSISTKDIHKEFEKMFPRDFEEPLHKVNLDEHMVAEAIDENEVKRTVRDKFVEQAVKSFREKLFKEVQVDLKDDGTIEITKEDKDD